VRIGANDDGRGDGSNTGEFLEAGHGVRGDSTQLLVIVLQLQGVFQDRFGESTRFATCDCVSVRGGRPVVDAPCGDRSDLVVV
jgi:hypothetical protein